MGLNTTQQMAIYFYLHGKGGVEKLPDRISRSGATRYCDTNSLLTASGSSANICILMKGSFPFCVNICQGLGRVSKSETLPWDKPKTHSPNSLWLMEFCERASLTCNITFIYVLCRWPQLMRIQCCVRRILLKGNLVSYIRFGSHQ